MDKFTQLSDIEKADIVENSIESFPCFVRNVFALSTDIFKNDEFTHGEFIDYISEWMGENKRTLRVSAKDHFKSMSFYAHIMWKLFRTFDESKSREIQYFSYKETMASYHLAKIKKAISCNPFFVGCIDLKSRAEGVISYRWLGAHGSYRFTVTPRGLLEFKRGIHCQDVYVDDPFQDPENKLILTKIKRINDVMKNQILDMYQDELHIAGTAQTNHDFFFDKDFTHRFSVKILPAVVNEKEHIALWKEWMDWEELMAKKRERGEKLFSQEYLCSPVYAEEAFLNGHQLEACINTSLKNYTIEQYEDEISKMEENGEDVEFGVIAGFDIGKKTHPSHLAIFKKFHVGTEEVEGEEVDIYKLQQLHSKWMDSWDYNKQIEYLERAIDGFRIDTVYYDNTRGEFESMVEDGSLPAEMEPVTFTVKSKHNMAVALDRAVTNQQIEFINEQRQINQMKIVNNDLQAPESPEGHGDSFWSIALIFRDVEQNVDIYFI